MQLNVANSSRPRSISRRKAVLTLLVVLGLLFGCATQEDTRRPPGGKGRASAEELREYLDRVQPEPVYSIRYREPLRWRALNNSFAMVETLDGPHLVELSWECKDLTSNQIYADTADRRRTRGLLRARADTLRGCRIESFYKLPEAKAVETGDTESPEQ